MDSEVLGLAVFAANRTMVLSHHVSGDASQKGPEHVDVDDAIKPIEGSEKYFLRQVIHCIGITAQRRNVGPHTPVMGPDDRGASFQVAAQGLIENLSIDRAHGRA